MEVDLERVLAVIDGAMARDVCTAGRPHGIHARLDA